MEVPLIKVSCIGIAILIHCLCSCFLTTFQVSDEWWCEPGHGDWCTCLEKYTLSRDGIYHKVRLASLFHRKYEMSFFPVDGRGGNESTHVVYNSL